MVNPFLILYSIICLRWIQNSWVLFLAFCAKFFSLVPPGGHAHQRGEKLQQVQGFPKRKQAKGILQILRKTKIDPDKDPQYLEAVLQLLHKKYQQRTMMQNRGVKQEQIQPLQEEIEAYETILFDLVPKNFISNMMEDNY